MSGAAGSSQWMYATGYEVDQSLKYNDDTGASLTRTLTTAGNRRTWTWSAWVKRGVGGFEDVFKAFVSVSNYDAIQFDSGGSLRLFGHPDVTNYNVDTTAVFRDSSAWYHFVVAVDTTQGTASNRVKIYANGVLQAVSGSYPGQDGDLNFNNTVEHSIAPSNFDGYLAEVNFIEGTALTPSSFGETGTYGEWKPKKYGGAYGTNGFYLPFKQDYTVEGFSTVVYKGAGAVRYVGGTGFQPDLVWIKSRDHTYGHHWTDSVRGAGKDLYSDTTDDEYSNANSLQSFESDGFTLGTDNGPNNSTKHYVAWTWDMGGSNANNTTGSIDSVVRANATYGQSIVKWTGNGTTGHGLSSAPEMIIVKPIDVAGAWWTWHKDLSNPSQGYLQLNTTAAEATNSSLWDNASPVTSTTINANTAYINYATDNYIAYCFHSVTGYSKIGSYTGSGSSGKVVTTGFAPAFVLVKNTGAAENWAIVDNTRSPTNPATKALFPNSAEVEQDNAVNAVDFNSDNFTVDSTDDRWNGNGATYIYMAFADKREYAYWLDQSGNNNDWTSNNLTESDISVDTPSNNFATMNPLIKHTNVATAYSEGNLKIYKAATYWQSTVATMYVNSGKWYAEFCNLTDGVYAIFGISAIDDTIIAHHPGADSSGYGYGYVFDTAAGRGDITYQDSTVSTGGAFNNLAVGTIIGITLDFDNDQVKFYANNVLQYTKTIGARAYTYSLAPHGGYIVANFGQDSSFAGNKTAQGNQDGNNIGDFYYTPPTGFLALCTKNLPDVAVTPSEAFKALLYTGTGSNQAVSGVGFQPDLLWVKNTATAGNNLLYDVVRGGDGTNLEGLRTDRETVGNTASDEMRSLDSDGFTTDTGEDTNGDGHSIISFNWKAGSGNTAFSESGNNPAGTHRANVDAGFSIVSYVGTGAVGTVAHGLGTAPEMMWIKNRGVNDSWAIYYGDNTDYLKLDLTAATADDAAWWNDTSPTSSVFTVATDHSVNADAENYIAYCWHSVDGYSKMGIYTGNGNVDGTFTYLGFRPAWVFIKRINNGDQQSPMYTSAIDTSNPAQSSIKTEDSVAIQTNQGHIDLLSNGFKAVNAEGSTNTSGGTYAYMAFAEQPFKYSNAR